MKEVDRLRDELDRADAGPEKLDEAARTPRTRKREHLRQDVEALRPAFDAAAKARDAAVAEAVKAFEATEALKAAVAAMRRGGAGAERRGAGGGRSAGRRRTSTARCKAEVDELDRAGARSFASAARGRRTS